MALEGLKKETRRMGIKSTSAGPWYPLTEKDKYHDGVGLCGHYDVELDEAGYCRDEECRRERLIKALRNGEAMMTKDGLLVWTPGVKIREV